MNTFNCRVYYEDTDAGGIVYYANYLKFSERARTECLRNLGIFQNVIKEKFDLVFVVKRIRAEYCKSARLDDVMEIRTAFQKIGRVSFELDQEIFVRGDIIFFAQVKLGVIDNMGRPRPLPTNIKDKMVELRK